MPISTWRKRKCRKCGKVEYILVGDCLYGDEFMLCDTCRAEQAKSLEQKLKSIWKK